MSDSLSERYLALVLALGVIDPDYVDSYYGPPDLRDKALRDSIPLAEIRVEATALLANLTELPVPADDMERRRRRYLIAHTCALAHRADMVEGRYRRFDEESQLLFDTVAPHFPISAFDAPLAELDANLPGSGPLEERYADYQRQFFVPAARVDAVFRAALDESRRRTAAQIALPANEDFSIEYVSNQVWTAYNWYRGNYSSLIQLNTDLPVDIDFVVHLAAHEAYPGHHVFHSLIERHLVRQRGWIEFSVNPLYSPQSLIAEGTANFGVDLVFPKKQRLVLLQEWLFPLAGFDPSSAPRYQKTKSLVSALAHASNQAARSYLDGVISRRECERLLVRYSLLTPERAAQRMKFIDKHRTYVINYNWGEDLVRHYLAPHERAGEDAAKLWQGFESLLSTPHLASDLKTITTSPVGISA